MKKGTVNKSLYFATTTKDGRTVAVPTLAQAMKIAGRPYRSPERKIHLVWLSNAKS